tara:strand:- start:34 stop:402 length:369 start_codon:yes stop_codon:yes gene_type:complete
MKKMLYFASGAPDATTTTEQVACFPADKLSHFEMHNATTLRVYFTSSQEGELSGDTDVSIDNPVIVLTVTSGKHKEAMQAMSEVINAGPHSTGFITIADSENSVFCSSHITACASVAVVDAS